jgi:hypothetical protein
MMKIEKKERERRVEKRLWGVSNFSLLPKPPLDYYYYVVVINDGDRLYVRAPDDLPRKYNIIKKKIKAFFSSFSLDGDFFLS